MEGFFPSSGVQRWTLNALMFSVPAAALYASPAPIVELAGSLNAAIASCRALAVPLVHARLGRERLNVVGHRLQLHGTVVDAGLAAIVHPDHRVLQPVLVVALGVVLAGVGAAAFLAVGGGTDGRLRQQDEILEL